MTDQERDTLLLELRDTLVRIETTHGARVIKIGVLPLVTLVISFYFPKADR